MPKGDLTAGVAQKLAQLSLSQELKTLHIRAKVAGKNKGQLMYEYTVHEPSKAEGADITNDIEREDMHLHQVLTDIVPALERKESVNLFINKPANLRAFIKYEKSEETL